MPENPDLAFTALSYGLTVGQFKDAGRIAALKGYTRVTRALALCMKYDPDTWVRVLKAIDGIEREGRT